MAAEAHPFGSEEHLIPLHVVVGAAGDSPGGVVFSGTMMGSVMSSFIFGESPA